MAETIRGGLSIGLSGFSFWSCDIGGFEGHPDPDIYKRWVAFGLLCSHSRLHGSNSYRVPWTIDNDSQDAESASAVLRTFVRLKRRLMPYIYAQAMRAIKGSLPLSLRAMALEFPEDPTSWFLDRQFMLGESILVAPVMDAPGHGRLRSGRVLPAARAVDELVGCHRDGVWTGVEKGEARVSDITCLCTGRNNIGAWA